jgi:hypothetical protein
MISMLQEESICTCTYDNDFDASRRLMVIQVGHFVDHGLNDLRAKWHQEWLPLWAAGNV